MNHISNLWIQRSAWLIAIRPKTLGAAVAPVLIGTALAISDGMFHLLSCLLCFLASILIQIGTNFSNDYYDFLKGADTTERLGPKRVTQSGLLEPDAVKQLFIIVFGLAVLCGVFLVVRGGWPILLIGLLSIASGILYTGGPFPLAYHGFGDIFVLLFFGPIAVSGTYYARVTSTNRFEDRLYDIKVSVTSDEDIQYSLNTNTSNIAEGQSVNLTISARLCLFSF